MLTFVEENYLKALLCLSSKDRAMTQKQRVGTNDLAECLGVKPSTVNEMLKRLKEKSLVNHEKYKKIALTDTGEAVGLRILRKHRLWETFLYSKLQFDWDEVHDIAEQLEHIQSDKLIERLDNFLGYPNFDPHGDPIPNNQGILPKRDTSKLSLIQEGSSCVMLAVSDTSTEFLQYLEDVGIRIGTTLFLKKVIVYDGSIKVLKENELITLSKKVSDNILVGA